MKIQLSDHFSYQKLIRFVLPSIGMMIFTSVYGVVDGFFVSNFAGGDPFAAINLIMPFLMIFPAIGFMVGTGGTALVSMRLGQGDAKKANETFSLLVYLSIAFGVVMTVIGELSLGQVAVWLGATEELLPYCISYGRIILAALVPFILQNMFQSFVIAAEKPNIGFGVTIVAGVVNIVLDAVLVGIFRFGVEGAAIATGLSQAAGGLIPLVYFLMPNSSRLRLGRTCWEPGAVLKACSNGSSEFMTNVSMSVVNMLYNMQLLNFSGKDGVAAYGVIMYVNFIFVAVFIGYSIGTAPVIGYNYGAGNHKELQNVFKKSLFLTGGCSAAMTFLAILLANPLAHIFVGYDAKLMGMTEHAFKIYSFSFLFMGFNIFGSAFFTALNNGIVSAFISFLRTLVFQIVMVLLLPVFFHLDGVWMSVIFAEILSLLVTIICVVRMRDRYHYFRSGR